MPFDKATSVFLMGAPIPLAEAPADAINCSSRGLTPKSSTAAPGGHPHGEYRAEIPAAAIFARRSNPADLST